MSIRTSSKSIGTNDAKSAELAASIRKAWLKAKPEAQAEIVAEFKIGYIAGRERISLSEAQAIFEAGKGAGAINPGAIDRATSAFNYHIRQSKATAAPQAQRSMRISTVMRERAMDFLAEFEGETLAEQIKQAVALLNALK